MKAQLGRLFAYLLSRTTNDPALEWKIMAPIKVGKIKDAILFIRRKLKC